MAAAASTGNCERASAHTRVKTGAPPPLTCVRGDLLWSCRDRGHSGGAPGADGGGIGGGVVRERRPAADADAVRDARRAAGDGAEGAGAGRAVPGVRGVRGEQGQGAVQGRLLAWILRQPHGLAPRIPGWSRPRRAALGSLCESLCCRWRPGWCGPGRRRVRARLKFP